MTMSKIDLFSAFATGRPITLQSPQGNLTGYIQGITLESGYTPPQSPHQFIVSVRPIGATRDASRYVRTID